MGLILDSSVLIAGERSGGSVRQILKQLQARHGETEAALSVITVVELTHGIYRAKTSTQREKRQLFVEELCRDLLIYPLTTEIAQLAGRVEAEQAAVGTTIAFEDLLIGSTALYLGYAVVTHNVQHFKVIPGLTVVQP
jgi:tRNA(fMet)-specific endonuclease VapC